MKNKNNKTIKWIVGILAVPLIILAIHFHFHFFLKDSYHADESVNKNATANFLHATAISISWINILHFKMGVQYDSTLMKPFTSLRDYYFNKGQKLVKKDNAEEDLEEFKFEVTVDESKYTVTQSVTQKKYNNINLKNEQINNCLYIDMKKVA